MDDRAAKAERWRERLLSAVWINRLTPQRGEAIALRVGAKPLNPEPQFDPASVPRWSLPMAVAWIAWRRLSIVKGLALQVRANRMHWRAVVDRHSNTTGWTLEGLSDAEVGLKHLGYEEVWLRTHEDDGDKFKDTWRPAMDQLWQALGAGTLQAVGYSPSGAVAPIMPYEWSELIEQSGTDERDALVRRHAPDAVAFHHVTVGREDLIAAFPAAAPTIEAEHPTSPPVGRRPRKMSPQQMAVRAWVHAEHGGTRPRDKSDAVIADEVKRWLAVYKGELPAELAERKNAVSDLTHKTVKAYFDRFDRKV